MCKRKEDVSEFTKGMILGTQGRAVLISDLISACTKRGLDVDGITDDCFFKCGVEASKDAVGDNPDDFIRFMTSVNVELFDKEVVSLDPKHSVARFHYCPLYAKWKDMGLPPETIDNLCNLANKSDYGRASNFKNVELSFPKRLGGGDEYCELDARLKST